MSFQPVVVGGGVAGWRFLQRTMTAQVDSFAKSPTVARDEAYFREKIGSVKTAQDLVDDRRLMRVVLGAFGLSGDLNNRFFIRKVLEEGAENPRALANRLADKRYLAMTQAVGLSVGAALADRPAGFVEDIIKEHRAQSFEVAIGAQDENMRFALALRRDLTALAQKKGSDTAKWFTLMGTPPLRKVFDMAFGLPDSFASLDLDRQLGVYQARAQRIFGSSQLSQFADGDKLEALTSRFLVRAQLAESRVNTSPAAFALQLLQARQPMSGSGLR